MLGHMSGAYCAKINQDLSLGSRFDFNAYSYESEWTMGAEWWIRRNWTRPADASKELTSDASLQTPPSRTLPNDVQGVIKARASTSNVGIHMSHPTCADCADPPGYLTHVGRANTKPANQCRCRIEPVESNKTYQSDGSRDLILQLGVIADVIMLPPCLYWARIWMYG